MTDESDISPSIRNRQVKISPGLALHLERLRAQFHDSTIGMMERTQEALPKMVELLKAYQPGTNDFRHHLNPSPVQQLVTMFETLQALEAIAAYDPEISLADEKLHKHITTLLRNANDPHMKTIGQIARIGGHETDISLEALVAEYGKELNAIAQMTEPKSIPATGARNLPGRR